MIRRQAKKSKNQKQPTKQNSLSAGLQSGVGELTFLEHVYELRARLFWIVVSLIVTSAIGFQYKDFLVDFVIAPLHGEKLVYLTPGGGFSFIFTVCLYFGALVTIPVIMYHVYRFLQPVLGATSRKFVALIILLSATLAATGAVFGYLVAIPAAIHFLSTFAGDAVMPNLTAESYLGFIVAYMLGLAALFQLPLLLYIFDHVRPFPPGALLTSQRFVIAGSVVAAAIITPTPDVVNQLIVAGPIILIYQLGALAVFIRRKASKQRRYHRSTNAAAQYEDTPMPTPIVHSPPVSKAIQPPVKPPLSHSALQPVQKKYRSIDGVTRGVTRQSLTVPTRTSAVQRTMQDVRRVPSEQLPSNARRQIRSLDGISVA